MYCMNYTGTVVVSFVERFIIYTVSLCLGESMHYQRVHCS